jgi:hypothetical protein
MTRHALLAVTAYCICLAAAARDDDPDDAVYPYRMAKQADDGLGKTGAKVTLEKYAGGHG